MTLSIDEILEKASQYVPGFRKIRLYLLLFFTLTMPLVIYLGNTEYGYTKTIYTFVYISFLLLAWMGELIIHKDKQISLTKLSLPVGLLLISGLLSLINASSKGVVLQSLALLIYFYLIYLLVANTIRTETEAKYLLITLITSAVGATVYGTLQFYGIVRGADGYSGGASNIISVMGNQNYLGGFISYLFIPAFILIFITRSKTLKTYLITALGLFFFLLFPIGARGAWLSLVIGFLVFAALVMYYKPIEVSRTIGFTLLAVILVLLVAYLFASAPGPLNSVLSFSASETDEASWGVFTPLVRPLVKQLVEKGGARVEDWYIGWEMFKDHPLVGIGLGNYKIKFLEYRAKFLETDKGEDFGGYITRGAQAHNEYVQFAAELGIIGIISILASLVLLFGNVFTKATWPDSNSIRLLGFALIAGSLGFLVHSTVSFPAHLPASSFAFVSFLGLLNSEAFGERDYVIELSNFTRYLVFGLLAVFVITVTVFAYRDWKANILMGKGSNQIQYGNYRLAKEHLKESLKLDFRPRHTYYYLGVAERETGNNEKAIEYFEKSIGQFEPYKVFLELGTLYLQEGRLEKSEENLQKFLSTDPEEDQKAQAKHFLAIIAVKEEKLDKAEGLVEEALSMDSDYVRAMSLQGDIARFKGNLAEAREKWEQSIELINKKLSRIKERLSGEVQLGEVGELESQQKILNEQKQEVQDKLDEL